MSEEKEPAVGSQEKNGTEVADDPGANDAVDKKEVNVIRNPEYILSSNHKKLIQEKMLV